jgi:hypothetical protein
MGWRQCAGALQSSRLKLYRYPTRSQARSETKERDSSVSEKENLQNVDGKGTAGHDASKNGKTVPAGEAVSVSSSESEDGEDPNDKNNSHCSICRVGYLEKLGQRAVALVADGREVCGVADSALSSGAVNCYAATPAQKHTI